MIPLETIEQQQLAIWLRMNWYFFYKSPSETYTTSWNQKRKNKLEGVTKWYPDMTIILKSNKLLFIELKRQKRVLKNGKLWKSPSTVSEEQIEWQDRLNKIPNVQCNICYWCEEAIRVIKELENISSE